MMNKGMSQTLTLIISASVIMMTALSVVFMVQGGITDTESGTERSECYRTLQTQCNITQASSVPMPQSCEDANWDQIPTYSEPSSGNGVGC